MKKGVSLFDETVSNIKDLIEDYGGGYLHGSFFKTTLEDYINILRDSARMEAVRLKMETDKRSRR